MILSSHKLIGIHSLPGYIPPKKPYGFEAMQKDILEFATNTLVQGGRLSMWMPTANDEDIELDIPTHPKLEVVSVCVQSFRKC
jgi:tRNA (guanine10-N2)-methyltransferase